MMISMLGLTACMMDLLLYDCARNQLAFYIDASEKRGMEDKRIIDVLDATYQGVRGPRNDVMLVE
eukprot:scaffold8500_cov54-Cylindrotheca_fusiformis.AAC.1